MAWYIEVSDVAEKQLAKLGHTAQKRVFDYLYERIHECKNPRHFGEGLKANLTGLWRYRVGDYRIICEIQDKIDRVLVLVVGHRRDIYKR